MGAYQWTPDYTGSISVSDAVNAGTQLDVVNDLGFSSDNHNIVWASIEHPIPLIPNIKVVSSSLDIGASSVLSRDIVFNGQTYTTNENITTRIDMSNVEYTLYYELLDNWINLDAGLTFRKYDGSIALKTDPAGSNINENHVLDFTIPLLYLKGRADLPFTGFFVDGEINVINYNGDSLSDTAFSVGCESEFGLGGKKPVTSYVQYGGR
ncbi:MAG: TIGR04219 family outer membrane beta-barrel protein [Enterobacterales bacterium]|nr:TIGR04219 family outer membrane beta-barrel protein [Enterobacterales bacterium]